MNAQALPVLYTRAPDPLNGGMLEHERADFACQQPACRSRRQCAAERCTVERLYADTVANPPPTETSSAGS